tara:strand:- start:314 stop:637 length:324 start_codon:yes stop_codon:yes gene_type:complete
MNSSTRKWVLTKISSAILIPLNIWFIINLISLLDNNYQDMMLVFEQQSFKLLLSTFLLFSFFFFYLTISEIFEDYLNEKKIKNVANNMLLIFAIIIPLITIISIYIS